MDELLKSNSGFESRIAFKIDFTDYSEDELYQIFINLLKQEGFDLDKTCKQIIMGYFENEIKNADDSFGNGRLARNLLEKIKMEQATRLVNTKSKDLDLITADDVTNVVNKIKTTATKKKIGFVME